MHELEQMKQLLDLVGKANPVLVDKVSREFLLDLNEVTKMEAKIGGDNHINWSEKPTDTSVLFVKKGHMHCTCGICD